MGKRGGPKLWLENTTVQNTTCFQTTVGLKHEHFELIKSDFQTLEDANFIFSWTQKEFCSN